VEELSSFIYLVLAAVARGWLVVRTL